MQNGAHAGNAEVKLQVAMVIQREGGDPVAFLEAESAQGARQLTGAFVPVGIRITERSGRVNGDNLLARIIFGRVLHEIRE
jgi:hypothetical protein